METAVKKLFWYCHFFPLNPHSHFLNNSSIPLALAKRSYIYFSNLQTKFIFYNDMFAGMGNLKKIQHGNQNQWGILCVALGKYELSFSIKRSTYFGGLTLKWWKCAATFPISEPYDKIECNCRKKLTNNTNESILGLN